MGIGNHEFIVAVYSGTVVQELGPPHSYSGRGHPLDTTYMDDTYGADVLSVNKFWDRQRHNAQQLCIPR